MIDEVWERDSLCVAVLLTVALVSFMIVGAKLVFGDWGTAWNVGCFVIALVTLLWMWTNSAND